MNGKILLTSFDTFSGHYNASRRLAQNYFGRFGAGCDHLPLSVDDNGVKTLVSVLRNSPPAGLILMGEHSGLHSLRLETKANPIPQSLISSSALLNSMLVFLHGPIHLLCFYLEHESWFVRGPCRSLIDQNIEIKDSDFNYFYCNAVYRVGLQWGDKHNPRRPVAFVHVPKKENFSEEDLVALEKIVMKMKEAIHG